MRHRNKGRKLGRNPKHQRALLRNLVISIVMTEDTSGDGTVAKVPGRIITTLEKAKEVRPLVEKCVTLARKAQKYIDAARNFNTSEDRGTASWKAWRQSEQWQKWNQAIAPAIALRRRALQLIGSKKAVKILFDTIGPRFVDRDGGYTRILRLAKPRLGDAGTRVVFEFVGKNDRKKLKTVRPVMVKTEE